MSDFSSFERAFHRHAASDPNRRAAKGIADRLGELPDPSRAAHEARRASARALLDAADALPDNALDFDQALDRDLARLWLKAQLHDGDYRPNGEDELAQRPSAGKDIGDGIFLLLTADRRPAAERAQDIASRLQAVPDYLEALRRRLRRPVARWVAMELERVEGLVGLFAAVNGWVREHELLDAAGFERAQNRAQEALGEYSRWLRTLPTVESFAIGAQAAERVVAYRGIEKSLSELHAMARRFLADTAEQLEELRARLTAKYRLPPETTAAELQRTLNTRYRVRVAGDDFTPILDRYQSERQRILAFIRERELFPLTDENEIRIMRTPPFMEAVVPAGAMEAPAPFREGPRESLVYLTLSEALIDEHTELGIPLMMIHEGIPGHHLQLAHASRHRSVIRRHFDAMEQAEGWTTMLEDYMLDLGYMGELIDEARFCAKRDLSRIGARVAIDLFFMTGERGYLDVGVACELDAGNAFDAAGSLLAEVTGFTPERVQGELNWYSQERGYPLCYLTGNQLVWELKADVARTRAGQDPLAIDREFHAAFLACGSMPISFMRRVFAHRGLLG